MKFITFQRDKELKVGMLSKDMNKVYDLNKLELTYDYLDMVDFISKQTDSDLEKLSDIYFQESASRIPAYNVEEITIHSPIIHPRHDILCLGLNYKDHVSESSRGLNKEFELPKHPIYFSKRVNIAIGNEEKIKNDSNVTEMIDYEVELAVVIGKEGINIPKEEAEDYIFGYTILNDLSARDLQQRHQQWFRGKSLDTFTAMGPSIVHKSQLPFPIELNLYSRVNGEIRQVGNTKDFIFDIATVIHDLSQGMTLKPGDIIATGTPAGVGMGFKPPKYLKSGDLVECEIENIGILRNALE